MLVHQPLKTVWPGPRKICGRPILCEVIAPLTDLRILKCSGWELTQNPEFNRLVLLLKSGTERTVAKWVEHFSVLGQIHDVVVRTPQSELQLYRPVCTGFDRHQFVFHYLHNAPQAIYD
jgi:hypothetical protein